MKKRTIVIAALAALATAFALSAEAEVKKELIMCEGNKMCPRFVHVFNPPTGWEQDKAASREMKMQIYVPKGKNYQNADSAVYIRVYYNRDKKNVDTFVKESQDWWRERVPDVKIDRIDAIARDNKKAAFQLYRYQNPSRPQQAHEMLGFGEDSDTDGNDYILTIVATAKQKKAIDQTEGAFRASLRAN